MYTMYDEDDQVLEGQSHGDIEMVRTKRVAIFDSCTSFFCKLLKRVFLNE